MALNKIFSLLPIAAALAATPAAAESIRLSNGAVIDGFADISGQVMANCPDKRYDGSQLGTLYGIVRAYKKYLDIRFELATGGIPWKDQVLQDIDQCLTRGYSASPAQPARPAPQQPRQQPETTQAPEPREPTEQEKAQQQEAIADKASDSVLAGFGDATPPAKDPKGTANRNGNPSKRPKYDSAVGCVQSMKSGHGMFNATMRNVCGYKINVSFCTLSARGTGYFDCKKGNRGAEAIAPGKTGGAMGAGVPEADDPFQVLFAACRDPGLPIVSGLQGTRLVFSCQ